MGEREWYFYSLRDRKYPTGLRTNRATGAGYWKATGKDREVYSSRPGRTLLGMKKTLVFYKGRAPHGEKTKWVMHEYRLDGDFSYRHTCKDEWVICRIFHKLSEKKSNGGQIYPHFKHHQSPLEPSPSTPTLTEITKKPFHEGTNTTPPMHHHPNPTTLPHPNPFLFGDHHDQDLKSLLNPPPTFPITTDTAVVPTTPAIKPCKTEAHFLPLPDANVHRWGPDLISPPTLLAFDQLEEMDYYFNVAATTFVGMSNYNDDVVAAYDRVGFNQLLLPTI